jgi:AcrR family transcriptional regulator
MKTTSAPADVATKVRKPRGRPRAFDRDAALDAAMEVFWSKGFEGASLNDLTRAMGINPPSLYATFKDKEGLFIEAIQRYEARQGEACPYCDEPTARASVEKLLTKMACEFTESCQPRGCMMVMASATSAASSTRLRKWIGERRSMGIARLEARIEKGVREGELPRDTDVAGLAGFYMAVLAGMSMQAREGASRKTLLAMAGAAMRAWPESPRAKVRRAA